MGPLVSQHEMCLNFKEPHGKLLEGEHYILK